MVSMEELIEDVGVDVARFFFLMRKTSAHLDFDIDLAKEQSDENPVYYVQYGHARICSILRHAAESGAHMPERENINVSLLESAEEITLIKKLLMYPEVIERCAASLEPQGLTAYLQEVAADFHPFYHRHRVVTEDQELTAANSGSCGGRACWKVRVKVGNKMIPQWSHPEKDCLTCSVFQMVRKEEKDCFIL